MLWDQEAPLQCCVCLWGCLQTAGPGSGGCWLLKMLPFVYYFLQPPHETNPEGDKNDYSEGSLTKTRKPYQEWQGWDMQRGLSSPLGWGIKKAQAKNITSTLDLSKLFVCTAVASCISIRDVADSVVLDIVHIYLTRPGMILHFRAKCGLKEEESDEYFHNLFTWLPAQHCNLPSYHSYFGTDCCGMT